MGRILAPGPACLQNGVPHHREGVGLLRRFTDAVMADPTLQLLAAVATGKAGCAMLDAEPADVVLVDLGLPDMDGTALIRRPQFRGRVALVLVGYVLLGPLLYLARGARGDELVARWWVLGLMPLGLSVAVFSGLAAWRQRTTGAVLIAAAVVLARWARPGQPAQPRGPARRGAHGGDGRARRA